jgi:tRNA(fMet)-specific endonuclease VapC
MKRVLLDTSAYTALLTGDQDVFRLLAGAETVFLSVIVLGELYAGFRGGRQDRKNREVLASFLAKPTVKILPIMQDTAEIFGRVKIPCAGPARPSPLMMSGSLPRPWKPGPR